MIASVASVAFSTSLSNQRSRIGRAAPVSSSTACGKSAPSSPSARYSAHSFLPSRSRLPRPMLRQSSGSGSGSGAAWLSTGSSTCGHALQKRVVARIGRRIARAELARSRAGTAPASAPSSRLRPSGSGVNDDGFRGRIVEPVFLELQLANDLRQKQADDVRRGRHFVAGPQLFGRRAAAQHMPPLEHAHLLPGPRQIRGAHQPVVPAADDDRVEFRFACCILRSMRPARDSATTLPATSPSPASTARRRRRRPRRRNSIAATAPLAKRMRRAAVADQLGGQILDVRAVADPADVRAALLVRPLDERVQIRARLERFQLVDRRLAGNVLGDDVGRLAAARVRAGGDPLPARSRARPAPSRPSRTARCLRASARAANHPANADRRAHRPRRVVRCR